MNVLALDLGGTNLRAARATGPVAPESLPEPILHQAACRDLDQFRTLVLGLIATERPGAIGIAIPGLAQGATCQWVPNLPWLDGVDMAALFPGQRIALANDAHMALLAEVAAGSAQGRDNAILLAIGTGIGSALLAGGRVLRGGATSFGWACADTTAEGQPNDGWLESMAAGRALDRAAATIGLKDGAELIQAARAGWPPAEAALAPATLALGTALAGAVALTGTDRIIISGGVSTALDVIARPVIARLRSHLPPHLRGVTLAPAAFGPAASIAGAAIAAAGHPAWPDLKEDRP